VTWPRIAALICGGGALLLLAWQWRQHAIVTAPMTPIKFGHQDHAAVSCKTCHHNFFDDTGRDACYSCHKQRPLLAATAHRQRRLRQRPAASLRGLSRLNGDADGGRDPLSTRSWRPCSRSCAPQPIKRIKSAPVGPPTGPPADRSDG